MLELGCAGGGNLLPFALAYPQAHVVGVDLSSVQVNQGLEVVQALGVQNLHLHAMSLTDITPEFGQFDYIIAHGVFSWVPPEVREAMLRILRDNLAPNGIGYISYNTYPGWKAGDIVRDAMLLHSHSAQNEDDKLAAAKAMLNLLSEGIAGSNPLAPSLRGAVAQVRKHSDYYIAHEYLETFNNPCYLLEFVNLADQYGLTQVGDADPHVEMAVTYGQNVQLNHSLVALGQPREMRQQYLDFAVGRNFRKSLVVHQTRADQVLVVPDMERLADLRWAGQFTEVEPDANAPKGRVSFRSYKNQPLHTNDAAVLAVVRSLSAAWPASLSFDSLLERVRPELTGVQDDAAARKKVLDAVQTLFRLNSLRYTLEASPYDAADATGQDTPALIPGFAHVHQRRADPEFGVGTFNLWHDTINIRFQDAEALVLKHIDGQRTRKQLATVLRDALNRGCRVYRWEVAERSAESGCGGE
ncbi:class I SAM-dependent methyltransferase [Neopusillimonas aromaticivorans]|uniref:class I SAM-dependent methyltransferase n=1 Tax=Neopusillimonas aromaticivorans TaxID=2979868 RepID=UPI00259AB29F|nr:class I SAM-dependent methyltransferase [Neopusillimonas aromaticivorans]WJJ93293.1 class I SAM-dependent methyltransferase [Neopusillimonas aromaticivorans]